MILIKNIFWNGSNCKSEQILGQLNPEEFDYILIDEAHRVAAPTYQKILNHFYTEIFIGNDGNTERMDKQNIYEIFDYHFSL